jgi:hypothetical protein
VLERGLGEGINLPPAAPGVLYIVPFAVAVQYPERDDPLVPDDLVREKQRVVGARRLTRVALRRTPRLRPSGVVA